VHSSNLILPTLAESWEDFYSFQAWVNAIMAWLRTREVKRVLREKYQVTEKVVVPQEAKWNTLLKAGLMIFRNWRSIAALADEFGQELDRQPEYDLVLAALAPFGTFIERVERDGATQGDAFKWMRELIATWEDQGTAIAAEMKRLLEGRFASTADGVMMELAHTLQPEGHATYLQIVRLAHLPDTAIAASKLAAVQRFRAVRLDLRNKVMELANFFHRPANGELSRDLLGMIASCYDRYQLNDGWWQPGEDVVMGWGTRRAMAEDEPHRIFCSVAEILTQFPASEAAAERLISVFEYLFNKQRMGSGTDLIDAEMMIRMWQIYHPQEYNLPSQRSDP
jgi:hypothetical protein